MWNQGSKTGNWSATFRGIGIVITVDDSGRPTEFQFFLNGKLDDSASLSCTIDVAKRIALEVVDRLLLETPHWQAAENREIRASFTGADGGIGNYALDSCTFRTGSERHHE
jgi:hypothetical protein